MKEAIRKQAALALRTLNGLRRRSKAENTALLRARGETADSLVIRDATEADIPALAEVHVHAWNAAYNATGPSVAVREQQWRQVFASPDGTRFVLLVQRSNGDLVGFAMGSAHEGRYAAQLDKIHLIPEYQRVGIGSRLLRVVVRRFLEQGRSSMMLFAEADNPSCWFYEALGGHNLLNDDGSVNYGNYGWDDLEALAARLDARLGPPASLSD
jgi:ribosomal protein S18 acetylase RimI-like enzyme